MTFPFLSPFFVYFSARINYRDAFPSKHTKDNGRKILKSVFGELFYLEEISLQEQMWGWGGVEEVKSGAAESKINVWDVCAVENLCQVSKQLKGNVC
jgi:hypothetical protein